jgi:hypothetical protein
VAGLTNNERVLRAIVAVSSAAALQLAAVGAPLFHAHLDDHHEEHHGAARVHAHIGGHESAHHVILGDGPAIAEEGDAELATAVQLFIAVEPSPLATAALPQLRFTLPAPLESIVPSPSGALHSHDPPLRHSGPSRAPPAFLS